MFTAGIGVFFLSKYVYSYGARRMMFVELIRFASEAIEGTEYGRLQVTSRRDDSNS
jgi:hypothetical protein